jgi:hypothetical protein
MPRYHFNTRLAGSIIEDPEGVELADTEEAWEFARTLAMRLLDDEADQAVLVTARIEVVNENGDVVLDFPLAEAAMERSDDTATRH